ncbi:MAG: shikimate dehydrogenase [Deltaproteobacteria bacterium]|nr:shikimate dehydrogenase [Deltaproteobacteria bacterium]
MTVTCSVQQLQPIVTNRLDPAAGDWSCLAGIIGDRPSQYAKSPSLWNAAFRAVGLDAIYLPLDVEAHNLAALVAVLRESRQVAGFNVTVPYKVAVMELLDDLDPKARQIGAVNTVARTKDGKLVGHNTDGQGFIDMLTRELPGQAQAFLPELNGIKVLLIGSGGAARAVAFYLADAIGANGHLTIVSRSQEKAHALASAVDRIYGNAYGTRENEVASVAPKVDLVVNASTKGQQGVRKVPNHRITCLEPYSALSPARPAEYPEGSFSSEAAFYATWYRESFAEICSNLRLSGEIVMHVAETAAFVDLIYAPLESVTLCQARWTGHRVLNGKGMNIAQASDAFVNRIMQPYLATAEEELGSIYQRVFRTMAEVW